MMSEPVTGSAANGAEPSTTKRGKRAAPTNSRTGTEVMVFHACT